ncbi:hypothetical protein PIB30_018144 [Stylosanthes scabra]|uniref:Secreted protein n=1 Tax=Stylosanthes scabra TaxID=79078 RepID=A0ABU6Q7M9_9FABA|nr:hypothetical protein [Stylosanthes scabra]
MKLSLQICPFCIACAKLICYTHPELNNVKSRSPFGHDNHNRSFNGDSINHDNDGTVARSSSNSSDGSGSFWTSRW